MLRFLLQLAAFVLSLACATVSAAAQPGALKVDQCLEELKTGQSEWIECYAAFETDASSQEELSRQTFNMVRNAKCGGTIHLKRAALLSALAGNGMLELAPQNFLCSIETAGDYGAQATITVAPKVWFRAKRIFDVSPSLVNITSLPDFLIAPLRSAAESQFVRGQLVKGLNTYLEQAFP